MPASEKFFRDICEEYITIDLNGEIYFKSLLKDQISKNIISKEDALFILLDILNQANYGWGNELISKEILRISGEIKDYNERNRNYSKKNVLKRIRFFNKPYILEIQYVIDYLLDLSRENRKKNIDIEQLILDEGIDRNDIKKCFRGLSTEDVCYMLDLNPDLTYEGKSTLVNNVIDLIFESNFDMNKLDKNTVNCIKSILHLNIQNYRLINEKTLKINNIRLLSLKAEFEEKQKKKLQRDKEERQRLKIEKEERLERERREELRRKQEAEKERLERERREELRRKREAEKERLEREKREELRRKREAEKLRLERERREELRRKREAERLRLEREKEIKFIIQQVNLFNKKTFSEMILEKQKYLKIHEKLINDFSVLSDNNVMEFKRYFSSFDEIRKIANVENKIQNQSALLNNFCNDLKNDGYLNYSKRQDIINKYESIYITISELNKFSKFLKDKIYQKFNLTEFVEYYEDLKSYKNLSDDEQNRIKDLNINALDKEIAENEKFFVDITDDNKKRAIVIDDKNVRVIAGAGTGKTFTIQNKVNYLIETKKVDSPQKILCLSYTGKGAKDLDDKVNKGRENNKVNVCTFHGFCRRVISDCGKIKTTNEHLLTEVINNYLIEIMDDDEKINKLFDYFIYYINPSTNYEDFKTYDELLDYEKEMDLTTFKNKYHQSGAPIQTMGGEIVRSKGELFIANYLFIHEIEYEYESIYPNIFNMVKNNFLYSGKYFSMVNLAEIKENIVTNFVNLGKGWDTYKPDFYFPKYGIYLEHFGIRGKNDEIWLGEDYKQKMEDKREFHKFNGTKLLETYFYQLVEGNIFEELEEILIKNKIEIGQMDKKQALHILKSTNKLEDYNTFIKLIKNFINIFEAQNRTKNAFDLFKTKNESSGDAYRRNRQRLFLDMVNDIYGRYFELNNGDKIDYNREISLALELIQTKQYRGSYDYILIDEYQDINPIRSLLLQELQKNTNAKLYVVGDDWQSIYKFGGSDLNLFIDFEKYFPNAELIKLEENRRNYSLINKVSSDFIMKNEKQQKKKLTSKKRNNVYSRPIKIVTYEINSKKDRVLKLYSIIKYIIKTNRKKEKVKILLLGRKNKDIEKYTRNNNIFRILRDINGIKKVECIKKSNIDITFMSVHKSKGLQYDEVIILNLENNIYGFPNKMEDDPILHFLKKDNECRFAEERRLFYVALTRTSNNVYLLAPEKDPSIFIDELMEKHNIKVSKRFTIDRSLEKNFYNYSKLPEFEYRISKLDCPYCDDGKITVVRDNKSNTQYIRCSNHPVPNPSHYNGGPYRANLEDYIFMEKCPDPNCDGVLIKDNQKDMLICSFNRERGCKQSKKIENINDYY